VVWCYYILKIVPQTGHEISLLAAEEQGEISTEVLIQVIDNEYAQFAWVATLINTFIMMSITVSYITLGTGLKHVLDGLLKSWNLFLSKLPHHHSTSQGVWSRCTFWTKMKCFHYSNYLPTQVRQYFLYILSYGLVLLIALVNPDAFLAVLESVTSLALNLESGVFIAWMYGVQRTIQGSRFQIPLQLHRYLAEARWLVMFYFVFAVIYDVSSVLANLISPDVESSAHVSVG